MLPQTAQYKGHAIIVLKTADGFQGAIRRAADDAFVVSTAFHPDSAGAFAEARKTIDILLSSRRR
jgi:hypothetical protein